ncbi:KAP family P-loop NTPase fold protein [Bacillus cereus]|uniref:KAP family P-loop NTPase fold protein n=1 Tax=Bacillus cereus TaxID=1396 RepID=UPI003D646733
MTMIYDNRPFEINVTSDLFGIHFKADSIKNMLETNNDYFEKNNLVALYGEWGSGKTSVMEYINKNITNYNVVFFEAWKYEKDLNLSLSLFEMILDKVEAEKDSLGKVLEDVKLIGKTLLNFSKNLLFNYRLSLPGMTVNIDQAAKDTIKEMDELIERTSFYTNLKEFNTSYNKLLDEYHEATGKKLLVFIDDLDRCAPENVLDLISSIKHFFIDSDKVVYFCGVDKHAVNKAINIRYQNIIKSEEYLEKVFDVTFNMPEIQNIDKLLEDFISRVRVFNTVANNNFNFLKLFFLGIKFTNPRKLKKLFNKYLFLCTLDKSNGNRIYSYIPENFCKHEPVQMVFTLFIILLHEFDRENFDLIFNSAFKVGKLRNILDLESKIYSNRNGRSEPFKNYLDSLANSWTYPQLIVSEDITNSFVRSESDNRLFELLLLFAPLDLKAYPPLLNSQDESAVFTQLETFIYQFQASEDKNLSLFVSHILNIFVHNSKDLPTEIDFDVHELVKMVNFYL